MRITSILVLITLICISLAPISEAKPNYRKELKKVTKRGQTFDGTTWDAEVIWHATFFSDKFRKAFIKKHATIHHMGPLETAQWKADQSFVHNERWDFIVVMYTKKEYKRFSMDIDSFWDIILTTENGKSVHPTSIEQTPSTPYEKVMFPYINRWSKIYRVSFPKVNLGNKIQLTLQSIVGVSTLEWDLSKS